MDSWRDSAWPQNCCKEWLQEEKGWSRLVTLDNGGSYPPDLSALVREDLGFPMDQTGIDYLRHVIEYRGRELTNSDEGRRLLMRYRIGKRTDKEVRLYVSGRVDVVPQATPIPEDAPVEEPR